MSALLMNIVGRGCENRAIVTRLGQLVVGPVKFDETSFKELAADDTAYNLFKPKVSNQFIMTGFLAFANKSINDSTDTIIVIYEATAPDTTTVSKVLFQFGMGKLTVLPAFGLNIQVSEGLYVNAKTTDDDILLTIMGYFVPVV